MLRYNYQLLDKTFKYEYNGIGNIIYVREYPYTPAGTEPSGTPTTTSFTYNTSKPDTLSHIDNQTVGFNANGGLSYYKRSYNWQDGKLKSFFRGSTMVPMSVYEECGYQYNAYGQRVSKTYRYDPNTSISDDASFNYTKTYQYDHSGRLINEKIVEAHILDVTSTREFVYLYDESGVIGCTYSVNGATPQTYYYQRNLLGDVIGIYNTSGNKVVEYAYDAWGNCTIVYSSNDSLANDNPIRYRGYYLDIENNFYYLNSRYYSPELRRFISPDDTAYLDPESVNGLNLYCYANNNPIPTSNGHKPSSQSNVFKSIDRNKFHIHTAFDNTLSINHKSFSVGLVTSEKYNLPSWLSVYALYAKGSIGCGYEVNSGYSLASFSAGILDTTFHLPKLFSSLPNDCLINPNAFVNLGTWNINGSIAIGASGTIEIISGKIGVKFGDAISISLKGYVGIGITADITNGFDYGIGWGLGYIISIDIDWHELFN